MCDIIYEQTQRIAVTLQNEHRRDVLYKHTHRHTSSCTGWCTSRTNKGFKVRKKSSSGGSIEDHPGQSYLACKAWCSLSLLLCSSFFGVLTQTSGIWHTGRWVDTEYVYSGPRVLKSCHNSLHERGFGEQVCDEAFTLTDVMNISLSLKGRTTYKRL